MKISISIEGAVGLTWAHWKRLVGDVEHMGFAGMYLSDHFTGPFPPDQASLEPVVALTYLADHSERVHFGPMVAPLSFRDPVMLARQALALDDLSGGRMVLGIGAGWLEREHQMFGYKLGDVPTRMARLEEGLEVITRLLRSDEPVSYEGRFFRLSEAQLLPRPQRPGGPPVMVGGSGPKRTLPLVARYADIWNAQLLSPDGVRERSTQLDELLRSVGRQPSDVRRTVAVPVVCGHDPAELERRMSWARRMAAFAEAPLEMLLGIMREQLAAIIGPPEEVVGLMRAYETAGIEELVVQWFGVDDIEGIELLAEQVLPLLSGQ
ncbi:MAG: TIGR03560 family F420-dependent LLM class oxidoreductase [Chloroflexota bacterium]|nr:TIGR03560 family F420-dependent LLM class oxidoreductase [Chloroflexota bacterium]